MLDRLAPQLEELIAISKASDAGDIGPAEWSDERNYHAWVSVAALDLDARRAVEAWQCDKASEELVAALRLIGALERSGATMWVILDQSLQRLRALERVPEPLWRAHASELLGALDTLDADDPTGLRRTVAARAAATASGYGRDWLFQRWAKFSQGDEYADAWAAQQAGAELSERQRRMVAYLTDVAMDRRRKEFEVAIAIILEHWDQSPDDVAAALERRGWVGGSGAAPPWMDEGVLPEQGRRHLSEASGSAFQEFGDASSSWAVILLPDPLAIGVMSAQLEHETAFRLSGLFSKVRGGLEEAAMRARDEN